MGFGFGLVVFCFVVLLVLLFFGLLVFVFWRLTSSSCSVSHPSMMTWAHRPHGVRTRGKVKQQNPLIRQFAHALA